MQVVLTVQPRAKGSKPKKHSIVGKVPHTGTQECWDTTAAVQQIQIPSPAKMLWKNASSPLIPKAKAAPGGKKMCGSFRQLRARDDKPQCNKEYQELKNRSFLKHASRDANKLNIQGPLSHDLIFHSRIISVMS